MPGNDREVMGDQHQPHVLFAHQLLEQVEDLRLGGDVERGGRLVGDQQPRASARCHGDADALALAAGQLVRIARRAETPRADRPGRASRGRWRAPPGGWPARGCTRFGHLVADGLHRVERGHRLLEDHADVAAAHPHSAARRPSEVGARATRDRTAPRGSGSMHRGARSSTCPSRFRRRRRRPRLRDPGSSVRSVSTQRRSVLP
jgi:hypothetical protein